MRISTLVFVFIMVSTLAFSMQLDTTWKKIVASDSTFLQNVSNSRVILYTAPLASTSPDTNFPPVSIVTYQIFKVNPSERSHFVRVDSGVGFLADVTDIIVTQINGNIELGDVTIDAVPSFEDPDTGLPARAVIDLDKRSVINVGSETIGLIDAIESVESAIASLTTLGIATLTSDLASISLDIQTAREALLLKIDNTIQATPIPTRIVALDGTTSSAITSNLTTDKRRWIEIRTDDANNELWFDYDNAAVVMDSNKFWGAIKFIDLPKNVVVHINSSAAVDLKVTEGGY